MYGRLRPALNKVAYPNTDGICSTDIIVLRAKDKDGILPELYSRIFRSVRFNEMVLNGVSGGQLPRVDAKYLLQLPVHKIPVAIQRKMVEELERYQRIITGARAVVSNYTPQITCRGDIYKTLAEIATFKPSKDEVKDLPEDTEVSFVPMADINTFDASFMPKENRKLSQVLSGFTYFKDNDILLAKITPCFENGKAAIARKLTNGIGFGSTEYIVIRANTSLVYPEWIFYHINTPEFIDGGKTFMTGTAGQQRIDINYVKQYQIPVPPLDEQKKLLDEIHREQALIEPSKEVIRTFNAKIEARIKEIWGE